MKTKAFLGVILALSVSCGGLGRNEVITWFDAKTEQPAINVSGGWESPNSLFNGGWGNGTWLQTGSQVSGQLGLYGIYGKVAGKRLYLSILNGKKVAYTAILELNREGRLEGLAYPKALADSPAARAETPAPVILVKVKD